MALDDPHLTSGDEPDTVGVTRAEAALTPGAELLAGAELLPCGRPLSRAWEQARAPAGTVDAHTVHCPYCQEAVEGLAALDRATRRLRAEEHPDSHSLANRIISAVRAEIRLGSMLLLDDPDHDLRISESAAAKALRRAADGVPGARAASCRLTPAPGDHALHVIAITFATALDRPLQEQAEEVRRAVLDAAHHILGLAVAAVDLEINSVLELPHPHVPRGERSELSER